MYLGIRHRHTYTYYVCMYIVYNFIRQNHGRVPIKQLEFFFLSIQIVKDKKQARRLDIYIYINNRAQTSSLKFNLFVKRSREENSNRMGRSPCCDENGLKKGPWTPEEDEKLVHYIHKHGHASWRALPKLAGLSIFLHCRNCISLCLFTLHCFTISFFINFCRSQQMRKKL